MSCSNRRHSTYTTMKMTSMKRSYVLFAAVLLGRLPAVQADDLRELWDRSQVLPQSAEIAVLQGVRFSVIKPYQFKKDGYRFLHGVALAWHKERLFASFALNKAEENTGAETAAYCVSDDDGKTWSPLSMIDAGTSPTNALSHGVFLSRPNQLWAFHGAFTGFLGNLHTVAYQFNDTKTNWHAGAR